MGNSSLEYQLPYKTRTMVELNDITTYAFYCIYQWLIVVTMVSGYVGSDCLFASLALHVTGQLAILRCKVKEAFEDSNGYKRGMKKLVIKHHRLIKWVHSFPLSKYEIAIQWVFIFIFHETSEHLLNVRTRKIVSTMNDVQITDCGIPDWSKHWRMGLT